jgi:hypothetical protein
MKIWLADWLHRIFPLLVMLFAALFVPASNHLSLLFFAMVLIGHTWWITCFGVAVVQQRNNNGLAL